MDNFLHKYSFLHGEIQKLILQKNITFNEQLSLKNKIQDTKTWIEKQPQRKEFLEKLNTYLQEQNIIVFNQMLTALVDDVLQKDKKIKLELSGKSLDISAVTNGSQEDIFEGGGGSLTNIISTGLRIISVARSSNRKFLLLDEADCWIKPERIELFAKIIGETSINNNIQIVMISHHNSSYFQKYGRVIELKKVGNKIESDIVSDVPFDPNSNYISKIRLQNLMCHEDTSIDFHPNVTCIIGENDIGKSVVASAFRCIANADSSDSFIRHHQSQASITLDYDKNKQIFWQRNKTPNPKNPGKVLFELHENNQIISKEYNSSNVPDFISDSLKIKPFSNLDIHLTHQKNPAFLINCSTPTEKANRAKILSLGKESFIVQEMMTKNKSKHTTFNSLLKTEEKKYFFNETLLAPLENVENFEEKLSIINELNNQQQKTQSEIEELSSLLNSLIFHTKINNVPHLDSFKPDNYSLSNTIHLENDLYQLQTHKEISQISSLTTTDYHLVPLKDTQFLEENISNIFIYSQLSSFNNIQTVNTLAYQLHSILELDNSISNLDSYQSISNIPSVLLFDKEKFVIQNTNELDQSLIDLNSYQNISNIPSISLFDNEHYLLENITELENTISIIEPLNSINIIPSISPIDFNYSLEDISQIEQYIKDVEQQQHKIQRQIEQKDILQENIKLFEKEKHQLFTDLNGICPCCGNNATIEQLI